MDLTENLNPSGRPLISLGVLVARNDHPLQGKNPCVNLTLADPENASFESLVNGLRKILPFMYKTSQDAIALFIRYGMNVADEVPIPSAPSFQWSHTGEILMCAYFEECEHTVVPTYKWRLNTANNQNPFGMDVLAFDFGSTPPRIFGIAVKTTEHNSKNHSPSVINSALQELTKYLGSDQLDDDLEVISSHLHVQDVYKKTFMEWYDPYSQKVPSNIPNFIAVVAIVTERGIWEDRFAKQAIQHDFGVPAAVRIFAIRDLRQLVERTYAK